MATIQKVRNAWLWKEEFFQKDWARLLNIFDVDEGIRDRTFVIKVWDAQAIAEPE